MKFYWIACCIMCLSCVAHLAAEKQDYVPSQDDIRIWHLLPDLTDTLAVEPALPKDFEAVSRSGKPDLCDGLYWGPREVVENYFRSSSSLNQALIYITLSLSTTQEDLGRYALNKGEASRVLSAAGLKDVEEERLSWGDYPVFAVKFKAGERTEYLAWIGLNDFQKNWTLVLRLIYPESKKNPSKEDLELWTNLLKNTTQLPLERVFRALGFDMQVGCTFFDRYRATVQFIAERRTSDQKLRLVIIPLESDVLVNYEPFRECKMEAKWHYQEPMVKIPCTFSKYNKNRWNLVDDQVVSILIKPVEEFSKTDEEVEKANGTVLYAPSE